MTGRTLFDPGPPHPKNDAAPLAGGAGVKNPTDAKQFTQPPLTSPARQIAPVGAGGIANPMTGYDKGLRAGVLATPIRQDSPGAISHDTRASRSTLPRTSESRRGELVAQGPEMGSGGCRGTARSFAEAAWLTHNPASPATIAPDTSRGSAGSPQRGGGT